MHDIEDLAKVGKDHKACPYFAASHFAGAQITHSSLEIYKYCLLEMPEPQGMQHDEMTPYSTAKGR